MTDINALLRHELELQRVATSLINKGLFSNLDEAYTAVRSILLNAETITNERQLNAITRAITQAINESMAQGWATYSSELGEVAIYDSSWYAQNIGVPVVPPANTIQSFIDSALMSLTSGKTPQVGVWADFVRKNVDGLAEQVNNLVKAGYINGATVNQISRTIKQFNDGLAKQQAEALARTALQHYMQSARTAMADANSDVIQSRVFFATMDNRVSIGCASLHLKEYKLDDDNYVRLPRHFNCRSIYLMRLKGQSMDDLLAIDRAAIGSGKNYESGDRYTGRASSRKGEFKVERIPADMRFGDWLKMQNRQFIDDVLGKTRADAFISGKLSIERMSNAWGNPLTLEQLKQRYPDAFGG